MINNSVIWPSPGEWITSSLTDNTYTIGEEIGEGSFSIVYACSDVWDNELAVKVLKPQEKVKEKAEGEFSRLMELRHPNITYVYDAFEYRNTFHIVTERCYAPISEIFDLPDFNGMDWLMPIARQLLQAVAYLHLNGYVHQDIHEGNVFLTFVRDEMNPQDEVIQFKLGDLGISKLLYDVDATNTRAEWLLPREILSLREFGLTGTRIDIYHLGLLFLQLACSCRLQFTPEQILSERPREMALQLPFPYNSALEKALSRHVVDRTGLAMELWHNLNGEFDHV